MSRPNRHAVTLVELLVVIAILGTLVAILLPAVLGAREAGRRTRCTNNQKEIASAINQFELAKKRFPGYLNGTQVLPADQTRGAVSWVVVVFPYLQRQDLWEQWATWRATEPYPVPNPADGRPGPVIGQLVCPDDSGDAHVEPRFTPLSYVANCGIDDTIRNFRERAAVAVFMDDDIVTGVFRNLYPGPVRNVTPTLIRDVSLKTSDIRDGASLTLLIAENVQATEWFPTTLRDAAPSGVSLEDWRRWSEAYVGMVWWPTPGVPPIDPPPTALINRGKKDTVILPPDAFRYARPSSNHPGGAVVAYCDGRAEFLSEEIDYRVFQSMMAPHDAAVSPRLVPP